MKTLRRSINNRVIGGVCGGIAEYFGIDPVLIRLIFVIMAIFGGAGVILYILAWIVMPERSLNDSIQDAEIVDNDKKKTDETLEKEFKNVAQELKNSFKEVEKEFKDVEKEFKDVEKEIKVEVKKHKDSSSSWFGIFLIFLGAVFLFRMFSWLNFSWSGIWKYWPVLLIFVGISCISMKKWLKNTLMILSLVGLLIAMICNSHSGKHFRHHSSCSVKTNMSKNTMAVETSREGDFANLRVGVGACKLNLFKTTEHLSEVWLNTERISFVEFTEENEQNEKFRLNVARSRSASPYVDFALNENPIWDLKFDIGAASVDLDLSAFKVKGVEINSGAANIVLTIGERHPETQIDISTGASSIKVRIPKNADCRVISSSFLMSKTMDGFVKSGNTYRTENFGSATQTITIKIDGAVGSFEIIRY
ncbi:MAG: PspC domain-containing protein [Bacteroidales bacterium]|nr:PspC domain-containing protein [Bacteroidales bacterium]